MVPTHHFYNFFVRVYGLKMSIDPSFPNSFLQPAAGKQAVRDSYFSVFLRQLLAAFLVGIAVASLVFTCVVFYLVGRLNFKKASKLMVHYSLHSEKKLLSWNIL